MSNVDFLEWLLQEGSFETLIKVDQLNEKEYMNLKRLDEEKKKI